jgi:LacI family transcriptional regulator
VAKREAIGIPLGLVAEHAGVSISTVSKVLNGRADVSAATRARVRESFATLGVDTENRPRMSTGVVDLHIHELQGAWYAEIIRGVTDVARTLGIDVVTSVARSPVDLHNHVTHALKRGTDGIISAVFAPTRNDCERAAAARTPVVIIDPAYRPPRPVRSIGASNWHGSIDAVDHLIAMGHRRIATITGPIDQNNALARLGGWRAALDKAGIPADESLIAYGDYSVESGVESGAALLALDPAPTAVFAASDDMALGAIRAARAAGLRVPDDLSIVGFDDLPISAWVEPGLTSVRQPIAEMGALAVEMIDKINRGVATESTHIELATTLIERESVAKIR